MKLTKKNIRAYSKEFLKCLEKNYPELLREYVRAPGHWQNKENCRIAALECGSHAEFNEKYPGALNSARNNEWFDEITAHFKPVRNPRGYWNSVENCKSAALSCKTLDQFRTKYSIAFKNLTTAGLFDESTKHLKRRKLKNRTKYL